MEQLINSLPAVLRASERSDVVYSAACFAVWNHVAGDALRHHAVAISYTTNRLTVAVGDAIWQKQLVQMTDQLIYRLNSVLGQPIVRSIEFVIAPHELRERRQPGESSAKPVDYPPEIVAAAANIHDAALRRAFLGAANSCLNRLKRISTGG